jgi:hypothetical protein
MMQVLENIGAGEGNRTLVSSRISSRRSNDLKGHSDICASSRRKERKGESSLVRMARNGFQRRCQNRVRAKRKVAQKAEAVSIRR